MVRKCGLGGLLDSSGVDPSTTIKGKSALFDLKRQSASSSLVSLLRNEDLGKEEERLMEDNFHREVQKVSSNLEGRVVEHVLSTLDLLVASYSEDNSFLSSLAKAVTGEGDLVYSF